MEETGLYRAMLSANRDIVLPGEIWCVTSLMNVRNNKGPSTEPCGTPERTERVDECSPLTTTS